MTPSTVACSAYSACGPSPCPLTPSNPSTYFTLDAENESIEHRGTQWSVKTLAMSGALLLLVGIMTHKDVAASTPVQLATSAVHVPLQGHETTRFLPTPTAAATWRAFSSLGAGPEPGVRFSPWAPIRVPRSKIKANIPSASSGMLDPPPNIIPNKLHTWDAQMSEDSQGEEMNATSLRFLMPIAAMLGFVVSVAGLLVQTGDQKRTPILQAYNASKADSNGTTDKLAMLSVSSQSAMEEPLAGRPLWKLHAVDWQIFKLWFPATLNIMLTPLVGAVDVFWVGRMGDAMALASLGGANQVFNSLFWMISFLSTLVTPLVGKAAASGDEKQLQSIVNEVMLVTVCIGVLGTLGLLCFTSDALRLVGIAPDSNLSVAAVPYLRCRTLGMIPGMISSVGFAVFRGKMDLKTPLRITFITQMCNALLDPVFIFGVPSLGIPGLGVAGAAMATALAEVISVSLYLVLLFKDRLLSLGHFFKFPSKKTIKTILSGGLAVQLRTVALNVTFLLVTRATLAIDSTGAAAAAHTLSIQMWQIGGIFLLGLSSITGALIPQFYVKEGPEATRHVANRLLTWGLVSGILLGSVQIAALPLLGVFTSLPEVRNAAVVPVILGACLQSINGMVFVGEGIMQGHQAFAGLCLTTCVACAGLSTSLHFIGGTLSGVWASFWVFNVTRFIGSSYHHFKLGPLSEKALSMRDDTKDENKMMPA